jgi:hypothetical protein
VDLYDNCSADPDNRKVVRCPIRLAPYELGMVIEKPRAGAIITGRHNRHVI